MIARRWTALAEGSEQADAYVAHFEDTVRSHLESTQGFLGAAVERVEADGGIEIVVVTRWESMDAIEAFAGEDIDLAVVEPEARAVLSRFDDRVQHVELADGQAFGHLELIDIPAEAAAHTPWFNETLTSVNEAVVRLGVSDVEGSETITLGRTRGAACPRVWFIAHAHLGARPS